VTAAVDGALSAIRRQVPKNQTDISELRDAATEELVARLKAVGFDEALAHELVTAIPPKLRRGARLEMIRQVLTERVASLVQPTIDEDTGVPSQATLADESAVHVFIGPPGVGKTTTIAKIAARERARGGTRFGLIAADGHRVGAVEQLRLYADVIRSPFAAVRSIAGLERVLALRAQPVLVDTAGRTPDDRAFLELLACLAERNDVKTYLVVDAGQAAQQVRRTFEHYRDANPDRVILTKLDQINSLAPLFEVVRQADVPVSHFGTGQRVPDDLVLATASALAGAVLGEKLQPAA
jgi:flagellar biosynthesis protein FlhF